uniref:Uncharacterized protein n=1 Tax=Cacopsylla melanoneura TaxID=428564 RepID=A0A8D8RAQ5_9HEMI
MKYESTAGDFFWKIAEYKMSKKTRNKRRKKLKTKATQGLVMLRRGRHNTGVWLVKATYTRNSRSINSGYSSCSEEFDTLPLIFFQTALKNLVIKADTAAD